MSAMRGLEHAIREVDTPHDRLELEAEFEGVSPAELFRYWTEPELLTRWWPVEAEVEAKKGGSYHLFWPNMEWHLHGTYHTFNAGRLLVFTWRWDHEPHTPTRIVTLDFQPLEGESGTRLHLTHGYYREHLPKDMEERQGHLEGWHYFLRRLQEVTEDTQEGGRWQEIARAAPSPLWGEDAQANVTHTKSESDQIGGHIGTVLHEDS